MRTIIRGLLGLLAILVVLAIGLLLWVKGLAKDTGPEGRPTYGSYTWADTKPPRGGPTPRADGYVMGSEGHDFILPPMPPVRSTDIHRADSVAANNAIRSCFWPGPKLRPGFYTTDPDDYGLENQLPDTGNTFSTAWFKIPEGAKIVMKGDFPAMRHWSYTTYSTNGVPRDVIDDVAIDPDAGSFNPFRPGVARDAKPRKYAVAIMNGDPPSPRPANTVYTRAPAMTDIGMHMRNYVPDRSVDWAGGVGVPQVELHLADGKVLTGQEACDATAAPLREKQVPLPIPTKNWVALTRLPWMPADQMIPPHIELRIQLAQRGDHQIRISGHKRQAGDKEVQRLVAQMLGQVRGFVHIHVNMDACVVGSQIAQQALQNGCRRVGADTKGNVADFALAVQRHVALQAAAVKQQLAGTLHHEGSGIGAGHLGGATVKEQQAQLVLRRQDAAAERGLAQVALLGGATKVAGIGQGHHVTHTFQIHGNLLCDAPNASILKDGLQNLRMQP